jgi:hypothetical protein
MLYSPLGVKCVKIACTSNVITFIPLEREVVHGNNTQDANKKEKRCGSPDFCLSLCPVTRGVELYKVSLRLHAITTTRIRLFHSQIASPFTGAVESRRYMKILRSFTPSFSYTGVSTFYKLFGVSKMIMLQ